MGAQPLAGKRNKNSECLAPEKPQPPLTHRNGTVELKEASAFYHFNSCKRRATSSALARLLKALMRKKPSPFEPKPLPGVMTTFASFKILSNACQLVMPVGVRTQIYGAFTPPKTFRPAFFAPLRRTAALSK